MNEYYRAVFSNLTFFCLGFVFYLVATPAAIKIMGEEFYGLWTILNSILLFSNIGNAGIGSVITKFGSESTYKADERKFVSQLLSAGYIQAFVLAIITSGFILIFRNFIVENIAEGTYNRDFKSALFWIAIAVFPQFLSRIPHGYLLGNFDNWFVRKIDLSLSVMTIGGSVSIAGFNKDLESIAIWLFLSQSIILLVLFNRVRRKKPFRFKFNLDFSRQLASFSSYMLIQSAAISLFQQFDRILVGFLLGPVEAGVYSVATSVGLRLSMVIGQVTSVMIPYSSLKDAEGDRSGLYSVFRKMTRFVSLALAAMGTMLILWMREILFVWISPEYAIEYTLFFNIMIQAYIFIALSRSGHQSLTGMGQVKLPAFLYLSGTIVMLAGVWILSTLYGLAGAGLANNLMVVLLLLNLVAYRKLNFSVRWKDTFTDMMPAVIIPSLTFLFINFTPGVGTMGKALVSVIVFGFILLWYILDPPVDILGIRK